MYLRGCMRRELDFLADAAKRHDDLLKVWTLLGVTLHAGGHETPDGLRQGGGDLQPRVAPPHSSHHLQQGIFSVKGGHPISQNKNYSCFPG